VTLLGHVLQTNKGNKKILNKRTMLYVTGGKNTRNARICTILFLKN
jgi:hypothetical protein